MEIYAKYDPTTIIRAAEDKRLKGDLSGAEMMFQSALLEWNDDAREGAVDPEYLREAIANLWVSYAEFHKTNKAWKSAMETYEQAVSDQIAGHVGRIWIEYARFSEERGKLITAQNVYLRALVGDANSPPTVLDENEANLLWDDFLTMMQKKNSSLTLEALQRAVQKEHVNKRAQPDTAASHEIGEPSEKRVKMEIEEPVVQSKTHVVTEDAVEAEKEGVLSMTTELAPEVSAEWMARDGDAPPQAPEPPLFSPTRPKLTDPSGRDLLGDEMAVAITQKLLSETGNVLLEACSALWFLSAVKEKEQHHAIEGLDKTLKAEVEKLENSHAARLSVSGAARAAVEMMNASELTGLHESCSQRRRDLLSNYAWEFRKILHLQQTILTKLGVPGFKGPSVDAAALDYQSKICSLLHTAFFLRKNLGEETHKKTLRSQLERLKRDMDSNGRSRSPAPGRRSPMPPGGKRNRSPMHTPPRSPAGPHGMVPTQFPPAMQQLYPPPPPPPPPPQQQQVPQYNGIPPQGYPPMMVPSQMAHQVPLIPGQYPPQQPPPPYYQ